MQAAGAALYLLAPTTPMVFMGEEWAASTPWQFFTSFDDEVLADAVRRGRRAEFGAHGWSEDAVPDPQDPATRDASVLDWAERDEPEHARVLRWYTACIALRRELLGDAPTRFADVTVAFDDDARWVVMTHAPAGRPASAVVVNLAGEPTGGPAWRAAWRRCSSPGTSPAPRWSTAAVRMPRGLGSGRPPHLSRSPARRQASGRRSMPSCATVATSVPSAVNMRPMPRPRPPCADGECWA